VLSVFLAYVLTKAGYVGTHTGLALAISIAAIVNAWLLWRGLRRDGVVGLTHGWTALLLRFLVANGAMAVCLVQMGRPLDWWLGASLSTRSMWLGLTIVAGAVVYFAALLIAGVRPAALRLHSD
ncbi:MAG: murein biosynthesis integral membrane protein MurJ, partial [Woeseiaceae bacterium]